MSPLIRVVLLLALAARAVAEEEEENPYTEQGDSSQVCAQAEAPLL